MQYRIPMNLRLFDTETQTTLLPGLAAEMKTYYEMSLIEMAEPKLVHDQFGDKYPIPKNRGKRIEFRKYPPLPKALVPITEGVTPDGNDIEVDTIEAEIEQYGDWTRLSDLLELTAIDNNILQQTKRHGAQAGRTLDTITRDVINGGTQVRYAPKVAGGTETEVLSRSALDLTSRLTPDLFFLAAADLGGLNAEKFGNDFVAIIHPHTKYDLMRHPEWIDADRYAGSTKIFNGEIGKLAGIRFVETSEAKIWKDASCPSDGAGGRLAVYSTLVLGAGAYAVTELEGAGLEVIVNQKGYGDDPLKQRSSVGWKAVKTAERLVEEYMVRIESTSRYSTMSSAN